jgi:hypothetical protein
MPGLWIDRLVPETVQIHQGSETMVVAALGRLRAEDERMAGDAEAALGSLTWDRGLQAITQHGLQAFLWHEPPRKWLKDRRQAAHRRFAGAAAGPELDGRSWLEAVAAAELRGSGLATPPRSPWPWWPTCRPHRRARGLRPVDAHRHAGRTALAAGRRDLALEVFAAANRPRPSAGLPGRAIPGAHRPATTPPSPPRSPVGRPGRRCRGTPAIPAQPVVS